MSTTFCRLIAEYGRVEIPMIQRDYAQGRPEQHIVRDDFLAALRHALALPVDDPALPLDLDFVYGTLVGDAFQPLDGQQRLTTLFLLHWYLAWADGELDDFRVRLLTDGRSRFGYEVRPSSRHFIDDLADYTPAVTRDECASLSAMITDQPWYFRSWRFDPTIRSALSVLDQMNMLFRSTAGLYARLIDDDQPAITFQLLDLQQFSLSDDLYIKMNARGKPLTPFETFKARFERHLEEAFPDETPAICGGRSIAEFFAHAIDTRWSDFFWPFRDPATATFDDAVMNLMRVVVTVTRDPSADRTTKDLEELRSAIPSSYTWFYDRGWLDREMVVALTTLLERWSADPDDFRRKLPASAGATGADIFQTIITRPARLTFAQMAQFAGYVQFLVATPGSFDPAQFDAWMRVVTNLAGNTDYNRPDDLRRSLAGLRDLAPGMGDINAHLVRSGGDVQGFFRLQVAEERVKAHLIRLDGGWPERIARAEEHHYLRGQIGFLLRFAGVDLDAPDAEIARLDPAAAAAIVPSFDHYFDCVVEMLAALGSDPTGAGRLWERALLTVGDFLLPVGRNFSLLVITPDEAGSWRRLLRDAAEGGSNGVVLRDLWDRLAGSSDRASTLAAIAATDTGVDLWRRVIRDTPAFYTFSNARMLRFEDDKIYPLRTKQMNGWHAELYTYALYQDLHGRRDELGIEVGYNETVGREVEPSLQLSLEHEGEPVTFGLMLYEAPDVYGLYLESPQQPDATLEAVLKVAGFQDVEGFWTTYTSPADMKAATLSLIATLTQTPPTSEPGDLRRVP